MAELILASTSPYRIALLKQAGYDFDIVKPTIDERRIYSTNPSHTIMKRAMKKLESVCSGRTSGVVISADQGVDFNGKLIGKPATPEKALKTLMMIRGKEHKLITAVVVRNCATGKTLKHLDIHRIKMRNYSKKEAERYIEIDKPLNCAGAIKIESKGIYLIEKAKGNDYTAIIGLPMMKLIGFLKQFNIYPSWY